MKKKYYIAYGSNLNIQQMAWRCPGAKIAGVGTLADWQLAFRGSKTGSYLTIEPKAGAQTPVGVWEITKQDEMALDRYEGFPHFYYKRMLRLPITNTTGATETVDAMVYIMHEDRPMGSPTLVYVQTCLDGCMDFGIGTEPLMEAVRRARKEAV